MTPANVPILYPLKIPGKTKSFLVVSGDIEWKYKPEMSSEKKSGYEKHDKQLKIIFLKKTYQQNRS